MNINKLARSDPASSVYFMNNKVSHILAVLIGLVIGLSLSFIYSKSSVNKQRALDNRVNLVSKLGDINRLSEKGYPEAAKIFDADVFLQLGQVGNYYRQNKKTPTELDWILIDPAIDYLKNINSKSMSMFYTEAAEGIVYLKALKNKSFKDNTKVK
ncbi:hypothetical protein ACFL9T_18300 [Thermodesulfobacteriota bacterium]